MQEKLALRKTLRKVAAVGTSLAMVGITISGALAAGLSDYPSGLGFTKAGGASVVVYGADSDNAAAQMVADGLPGGAVTTTTSGTTTETKASWNDVTLDAANGFTQQVLLGTLLGSTTAFGTSVRESRVRGFKSGNLPMSVSSTSSSPKYHEQVNFDPNSATGCYVTTGLSLGDINKSNDAYGASPVLYGPSGCMDYQLKFEEALTNGNLLNDTSSSNPVELPLLGRTVLVEGTTNSATKITAAVGKIFTMAVNDVVNFDGQTFTLSTVGSSTVAITSSACPGSNVLISDGSQRNCGVYVIRVKDVTGGGTGISGTPSAKVTIGLTSTAVGTVNVSVQLGQTLTSYNGPDSPNYLLPKRLPTAGDKLCWPNNYVCISFDKMTQGIDDFGSYRVRMDTKDLYNSDDSAKIAGAASVILIEAINAGANIGLQDDGGSDTNALAIWLNNSGFGSTYTKSSSTSHFTVRLHTLNVSTSTAQFVNAGVEDRLNPATKVGAVNYKSTNFNINANTAALAGWTATGNGTLEFDTANGDFDMFLKPNGAGESQFIGHSQGGATYANDLIYRSTTPIDISDYKNDGMTKDGIVIKSYSNTRGNDELSFLVPPDVTNYKAILTVAQPTGIAGASDSSQTSASSGVLMKTADVPDVTKYNAVVVGGPCVNSVAATLLGVTFPACGAASGLAEGEAQLVLKANGAKKALLVYGWESDDTARAAVLLKSPAVLTQKLSDAGKVGADSVTVKGTSLEVAGITVA